MRGLTEQGAQPFGQNTARTRVGNFDFFGAGEEGQELCSQVLALARGDPWGEGTVECLEISFLSSHILIGAPHFDFDVGAMGAISGVMSCAASN